MLTNTIFKCPELKKILIYYYTVKCHSVFQREKKYKLKVPDLVNLSLNYESKQV